MIEPSILPGFMELLPSDQIAFNWFMRQIQKSYELFGFLPVDTPIIEKAEVLMAKGGEESEKQTYRFSKGENDLALRFDLTVPLARYVSQRQHDLYFPFKRYQIGKVYRGEKPQKGRFREFYQCDADVIGKGELPIAYDAEFVSLIYFTFTNLNLNKFLIRISNRKILTGLLEELGLSENAAIILRLADKLDKMPIEKFEFELIELNIPKDKIERIIHIVKIKGNPDDCIITLNSENVTNTLFCQGVNELKEVVDLVKQQKVPESMWIVDLGVIRGLEYYTGTVIETILIDYPQLGSVCGGGRYENLAGYYTKEKLPGVGISIGLTRFFSQLKELDVTNGFPKTLTQLLVIPMEGKYLGKATSLATILRQNNFRTEVYSSEGSLKKKLDYANKFGIKYVVIIGENEIKAESVTVKDMETAEQQLLKVTQLIEYLSSRLK